MFRECDVDDVDTDVGHRAYFSGIVFSGSDLTQGAEDDQRGEDPDQNS